MDVIWREIYVCFSLDVTMVYAPPMPGNGMQSRYRYCGHLLIDTKAARLVSLISQCQM